MRLEPHVSAEAPGDVSPWLLLTELNHRVRNELMAALSALRIARRDGCARFSPTATFDQVIDKLENFCLVHQILDRSRDHDPLRRRLEALCDAIAQSRGAPDGVHVALSADDVKADDETAWTVCVVASELITNAFRHAFHHTEDAVVGVTLREEREWILLTVADNGMGFAPRGVRPPLSPPGLGSAIVTELTERLGGCVSSRSGPSGTAVTVKVPVSRMGA